MFGHSFDDCFEKTESFQNGKPGEVFVEEDENLAIKVDELIQTYEEGEDEELNAIFEQVVSTCISGMKETLQRMNIIHDDFVWEGQFVRNGEVDDLVTYIQREGFTREEFL